MSRIEDKDYSLITFNAQETDGSVIFTLEASAENYKRFVDTVYHRFGKDYAVPGFRKGKLAPKGVIESHYGKDLFVDTAISLIYDKFVKPEIDSRKLKDDYCDIRFTKKDFEKGLTLIIVYDPEPHTNLGQYTGIELKKTDYTVHKKDVEEAVEHRLSHVREDHAREESPDRPVENGDITEIDYSGSIDGVPFDGGTAEHQKLEIGSGSFIPGFEEQLIGMKVGEERDITVKFPDDYHAEQLAGKEAVFRIKLHSITVKIYPELDDDFASEVSEFETFAEYRKSIYKEEEARIRSEHEDKKLNDAVMRAIEASDIFVPNMLISREAENMAQETMESYRASQLPIETFAGIFGMTVYEFLEGFRENAKIRLSLNMLLEAIVKAENIEVTDEEIAAEAERVLAMYTTEDTPEEQKTQMREMLMTQYRENMAEQLCKEKAQKRITDSIVMK